MSSPHKLHSDLQRAEFPSPGFGALFALSASINYQSGTKSLGYIPINGRVLFVFVQATTSFNGSGATIDIGDASDADRLLDDLLIDKAAGGVPSVGMPDYQYTTRTELFAVVGAGTAATAGVARVIILYSPS